MSAWTSGTATCRRRRSRPRRSASSRRSGAGGRRKRSPLLALVGSDQLALGDGVLPGRVLDVGDLGVRGDAKLVDIEGEQLEVIVVRPVSFGWARAAVAGLAEVVGHFGADALRA